jgi:hypothetical protein
VVDAAVEDEEFSTKSDEEGFEEGSDKLVDGFPGLPRTGFFVSNSAGRFGDEKVKVFRLLFRFPGTELSGGPFLTLAALVAFAADNLSSVSESD